MATSIVTNKLIQLKDADGNPLYPKVLGESIPDGSVIAAHLSEDIMNFLQEVATNITTLQNTMLQYEVVS